MAGALNGRPLALLGTLDTLSGRAHMTAVADLDTPVVTVDLEIMRDNIRRV